MNRLQYLVKGKKIDRRGKNGNDRVMTKIEKDRDLAYLGLQADWTRPMRIHLYRRIALTARRRVLDIGCADGYITAEIAARSGGEVVGIDITPERVCAAQKDHPGVAFQTADVHDLPFDDGVFDAVITNFTLMWTKRPDRVLAEAKRVLTPGGAFLASGEPDYGGRIDEPPSLSGLAEAWVGSIEADGGDPFFGRRLKGLLVAAGFESVEVGVAPSIWEGAAAGELDTYLCSLRHFLAGRTGGAFDIEKTIDREKEAARSGTRLVFLPIFWGIGEKG
jgi:SAM-dependent methyltransferase